MNTNDGGQAFPIDGTLRGMTLRDYFAAQALQGFLASTQNGDCDMNTVAKSSFLFADAMLNERKK